MGAPAQYSSVLGPLHAEGQIWSHPCDLPNLLNTFEQYQPYMHNIHTFTYYECHVWAT